MNQIQTAREGVTRPNPRPIPTCLPARLCSLPGVPRDKLAYTPLPPKERSPRSLLRQFCAAPQFAGIDPKTLLSQRRGGLGVILLTQDDYCARQAAMYLTALLLGMVKKAQPAEPELPDALAWLEENEGPDLKRAMLVASPSLLDPTLGNESRWDREIPVKLDAASAMLVTAPDGPVLSRRLIETLPAPQDPGLEENPNCVFVALHPQQVDRELVEELRFSYGYQVCRVGLPNQDYWQRCLMGYVTELLGPPAPDFDPCQVVAALRRYRGAAFEETDLERAALWAVQKSRPLPVTTQDLIFPPLALESRGREQLEAMVELQEVKETVKRLCARLALEQRRALAGQPMAPACRNLAFSGPPGTGKSVTARLLAQILREEGVGTGRFVEAGREQLVGTYLGQTSPKVAALFEKARGGVLFIDEAGALLSSRDDDAYVVEAVNALVRHMELHPETLVIFATYPGEMERLLASNPGLSSRVAQVLDFSGYDDETLWQILGHLARRDGFALPEEGKAACLDFFQRLRRQKGDCFGNGREARRLFQGAVEEMALRTAAGEGEDILTASDLEQAARRLLRKPEGAHRPTIGF